MCDETDDRGKDVGEALAASRWTRELEPRMEDLKIRNLNNRAMDRKPISVIAIIRITDLDISLLVVAIKDDRLATFWDDQYQAKLILGSLDRLERCRELFRLDIEDFDVVPDRPPGSDEQVELVFFVVVKCAQF